MTQSVDTEGCLMDQMSSHPLPDRLSATPAPGAEQIPSAQAKMLRSQEPDSDLVAGNFVGQQLANRSLKTGWIAGRRALFASSALGLELLGFAFRATGVKFFLQSKVADDSLDAPNANKMVSLLELLGNDLSRSIRIQETMTNDLTDHLLGAPIVRLWPAHFALQSQGALRFKLL